MMAKYGIQKADIYNFDETGFIMGKIFTNIIITNFERRARPKTIQQSDREWATVIQAVNSTNWAMPPYIIIAGRYHLCSWYDDDTIPKNWKIRTNPNE
jgi:hypothetical protein